MTLKELIRKNPEGFTFDMSTGRMAEHEQGYYVAITDNRITNLKEWNDDVFLKMFNALQNCMPKVKLYIEGWKDGKVYCCDVTLHADNFVIAGYLAKAFIQKSYYDIEEGQSKNT